MPTDWSAERDRIEMSAVATRLLGPAPGRRGGGRKLWWLCPFHEDRNPSLEVDPNRPRWWQCRTCGARGDAIDLVRRLNPAMSFPEAVAFLLGGAPAPTPAPASAAPPSKGSGPASSSSGLSEDDALALVDASERRLWGAAGTADLCYLKLNRCLEESTIRAARLGSTGPLALPGRPRGIVLAWWERGRATLVKVRQLRGRQPKYCEVYRRGPELFLGNGPIRPGRPLVLVEGEFDALLLGQELRDVASVATLGGASCRPSRSVLNAMFSAEAWYIATDNDPAGDRAAAFWPASSRRVRPPGDLKDWTDLRRGGVNLRRWWGEVLAGNDR